MADQQKPAMAVNIPANAPPHVYAAAAEQALEWGRPEAALEVSELGLARHPAYAGLRLFHAEALLMHQRFEEGEVDLRAALAAEPQHPRATKTLAQLLMSQGRFREALPILERAEFILMGDPEIVEWLRTAEQGAENEAVAEPLKYLDSPETAERLREMALAPGNRAISLSSGGDTRSAGADAGPLASNLERLATLEGSIASVLTDVGFGTLTDMSLQGGDTAWSSHSCPLAVVRVVSDARVREGLIAWHCQKLMGEAAG
jgi:tetratricopeptide (TPR) repeat protein